MAADRDAAQAAAAEARGERDTLAAMVQVLEGEAHTLKRQLGEEAARARAAADAAAAARAQAAAATARVAEVEGELREVLLALEQHKAAAAAKFAQLQSVLLDAAAAPFGAGGA